MTRRSCAKLQHEWKTSKLSQLILRKPQLLIDFGLGYSSPSYHILSFLQTFYWYGAEAETKDLIAIEIEFSSHEIFFVKSIGFVTQNTIVNKCKQMPVRSNFHITFKIGGNCTTRSLNRQNYTNKYNVKIIKNLYEKKEYYFALESPPWTKLIRPYNIKIAPVQATELLDVDKEDETQKCR